MFNHLQLVKSFLNYPFALFQNRDCIFDNQIDDSDVLMSFSKHLWDLSDTDHISLDYFRGLVFASIKYMLHLESYMLVLALREKETESWSDHEWTLFGQKITSAVAILTETPPFPIKRIETGLQTNTATVIQQTEKKTTKQSQDFLDNYQLEKIFSKQLKKGDTIALNQLLSSMVKINDSQLSANKLTEQKYHLVSLITLMTRSAIQYGCHPNVAYPLSDKLILKMDGLTDEREVKAFRIYIINELSILIRTRSTRYSSEVANLAAEFIQRNLYEKIQQSDIADYASVHPNYLSSAFKKATGSSLHQFLINARIDEAKYLLSYTELSLKEISEELCFSNQSHFCKLFKAQTAYTPKEFRILF